MHLLGGRGKRRASSPGAGTATAAASRGGAGAAEDLTTAAFPGDGDPGKGILSDDEAQWRYTKFT